MMKYKLTCPECGAEIMALIPEAVVWERCPGCFKHTWDLYDIQMAEPIHNHQHGVHSGLHPGGHAAN